VTLIAVESKVPGRRLLTMRTTIEIEGEKKPALVADAQAMLLG
jgi:hypothetical protein